MIMTKKRKKENGNNNKKSINFYISFESEAKLVLKFDNIVQIKARYPY